mmetsp:Transcript_131445/g.195808  ORF Transcript_131445/g.195808 Transcript_131445/m.195808 type:complete len:159 (-) Transcript_131445:64-540(-)|eukprot:CAMPEP_0175813314 /NCGR_PEP_ID=MMETSP0107_2-20121207/4836_1 /TAXON_ID=195067 ORGANISM="Goniomonas pacifica, Strain CCMP1869" /NCGR_SAMPLE_ID=MMETSP0107_2 /ASSEMBLY_ACC=CAM_ASM_000203 /LENGTH=158 /DNA_ID=CAMNT_0017125219 /DNA_START=34 /DNA_END=510 /DNA_ORIENTATION=+
MVNKRFEAASGTVPADLIWSVVRRNNAFLVKRDSGRNQFSSEPGNVMNTHSFKFSGIANLRTVDLAPSKRADGSAAVTMTIRSKSGKRRPARALKKTALGKDASKDMRRVANAVAKEVGGGYRDDLKAAALARWTNLHRSILRANNKGGIKKGRKGAK